MSITRKLIKFRAAKTTPIISAVFWRPNPDRQIASLVTKKRERPVARRFRICLHGSQITPTHAAGRSSQRARLKQIWADSGASCEHFQSLSVTFRYPSRAETCGSKGVLVTFGTPFASNSFLTFFRGAVRGIWMYSRCSSSKNS